MTIDPTEHRHGAGDLAVADAPEGRLVYCVVCGERFVPLSKLKELSGDPTWDEVASRLKAAGHLVNPKPIVAPPPTPPAGRVPKR